MNYRNITQFFSPILVISLLSIMMVITGLLIFEYRFFKDQSHRMQQLQKDYQEYITVFKKKLYEEQRKNDVMSKEMNQQEGSNITLVNREALYLKKSALDFGKTHNVEKVIKPLYEGCSWDANYSAQVISSHLESEPKKVKLKRESVHYYPVEFTLSWPINKTQFWISSHYGPRKNSFHFGIDLAALKGTPVYPAAEGVVIEASYTPKGYGKSIVIDHNKCKTRYAHLHEMYVKVGDWVTGTRPIGSVGKTGLVKGKKPEHLHFEVIDQFGKRMNPLYILR